MPSRVRLMVKLATSTMAPLRDNNHYPCDLLFKKELLLPEESVEMLGKR